MSPCTQIWGPSFGPWTYGPPICKHYANKNWCVSTASQSSSKKYVKTHGCFIQGSQNIVKLMVWAGPPDQSHSNVIRTNVFVKYQHPENPNLGIFRKDGHRTWWRSVLTFPEISGMGSISSGKHEMKVWSYGIWDHWIFQTLELWNQETLKLWNK